METSRHGGHIRLAELMATLSLATDLGTGQPREHQLGVSLSALELAERLDCSSEEYSEVYYVALLAHLGCSAVASDLAAWAGGDEIHFQRGAPVLGPAAQPTEVMRHFARRLADDRPLVERTQLVATALTAMGSRYTLMGANLCEGLPALAERLRPACAGRPCAGTTDGTLGWQRRPWCGGRRWHRAVRTHRPRRR